jgi:signal peptidase I
LKPLFVTPLFSCFHNPGTTGAGGRLLFASRFRKPRRFRLVCFRPPPTDRGPEWLIHRLCGLPGDVLEVRKGILFVNGVDADKDLDPVHIFKVNHRDRSGIRHDPRLAYTIPSYPEIVYLTLAANYVRENHLPAERHLLPPGLRTDRIYATYKMNWNEDNFGPVKVPPRQWFLLGDDRSHCIDSRHFGFVDQDRYVGTVL